LSSVAKVFPYAFADRLYCCILWPRHGYEVVNTRGEAKIGALPSAGSAPVEWRVSDGAVDYDGAVALMAARAAAIAKGEAPEFVWLLEHPPLYTAGTSARPQELIEARFPVHAAGRGGQFTYHGPGQRVGYLMLDLKRRAPDVRRFVATVEEWIIRTLAAFSVYGERRDDRIGVWVPRPDKGQGAEDKIAAIGIRVQRWVTLHGFSLNVAPDLSHFTGIVPCGVSDQRYGVTSLADLGKPASMTEVDRVMRREFEKLFGATADAQPPASTENTSPGRRNAKSAAPASR
jgi:lipoyl(octanoyl) transferase